MAPEMVLGDEYDPVQCDLWGLGLFLYLFIHGTPLLVADLDHDLYHQFVHFTLTLDRDMDPNAADLLRKLLSYDPTRRPAPREILTHKFLMPSVPFPIVRVPYDLDPDVKAWLDYLGFDIQDAMADCRAMILNDGTLSYHLSATAAELGKVPVEECDKVSEEQRIDPNFVLYPKWPIQMPEDEVLERPNLESASESRLKKRQKLRKLLEISTSRLEQSGSPVIHVDAFVYSDGESP
jgi:serine/threonine protein kinase